MHELSICRSILSQIESLELQPQQEISVVHLQVGPLSGIESQLLKEAWPIAIKHSLPKPVRLDIEEMPIIIRCSHCTQEGPATANRLVCSHCGNWETTLIGGDEMILRSIEVESQSHV